MPLLQRYEIPATVFVTAGQVESLREFWWDELDRLLLQPGMLPAKLQLNFNGSTLESELGVASTYTVADYDRDRDWHIARRDDPGPRQRLFRKLLAGLSILSEEEREKVITDLWAWAGAEPSRRPTHRGLNIDELIRLQKAGLTEVAAHTMSHPKLAYLPWAQQRHEIQQSKKTLEGILNHAVTSFAFPFGSSTRETLGIVQEAGFECACSTQADTVFQGEDPFYLPRVTVRDWDGEKFARFLRSWIGS
jgi:peptidoglycan/xylan/chitin deacetylase (PgdA/CDA1 family)